MRISIVSPTCYIDFDEKKIVFEMEDMPGEKQETDITQPQLCKILEFLAKHAGEYVSAQTLLRECWGIQIEEDESCAGYRNTLYPEINNCRKLNAELGKAIENKRGFGYRYTGRKIAGALSAAALDMRDVQGFCIGDSDHSGCRILGGESGPASTTAVIDFSLTDSKLCSVVYYTGGRDWSHLADSHTLCFEARVLPGPVEAEVEVRLKGGRDRAVPVLLQKEKTAFEIPLREFASRDAWEEVQEIHLLLRRRAVAVQTTVAVENLRLDG